MRARKAREQVVAADTPRGQAHVESDAAQPGVSTSVAAAPFLFITVTEHCQLLIEDLPNGWRAGFSFAFGLAKFSAPPRPTQPACPILGEAVRLGLRHLLSWITDVQQIPNPGVPAHLLKAARIEARIHTVELLSLTNDELTQKVTYPPSPPEGPAPPANPTTSTSNAQEKPMASKRRILKVKYDLQKVSIDFEVERSKDKVDEYTIRSTETPTAEFKEAFDALKPFVCEWCDLPASAALSLTIRGVSFSNTNDVMGASITALKSLKYSNSPLVLNTPHKPEEPYSEGGDEDMCLTSDCAEALYELIAQTNAYIDGQRAQMTLFGTAPDTPDAEDAPEPSSKVPAEQLATAS